MEQTISNAGPKSFDQLVAFCGDKAYNFAFRLTGNEQDARDLVQEAFAKALKHLKEYDWKRPFEPWLNRILKNIFLDQVRKYEHKHLVPLNGPSPVEDVPWENILPGGDSTPEDELDKKETGELVQRALSSLPIPYRTAVILCDIENYSYQEISEVLGCPIGTVRSRIHQGRLLLKRAFESLQLTRKKVEI